MAIRTGISSQRGAPIVGELFLNTDSHQLEIADGNEWWASGLQRLNGGSEISSNAEFPADAIDLKNWKITLPVLGDNGKILEIMQPKLATFKNDKFFTANDAGNGIRFRVFHGGATTSGSKNPRCELREMKSGGAQPAKWSTTSGRHVMEVRGRVNRLTHVKPHVVIGQIHGGDDDVTVWRVEGRKLFVTKGDNAHGFQVTDNFELGTEYRIKFEAKDGKVRYTYNGDVLDFTLSNSDSSCYFKAGNYLQSNPDSAPSESTSEFSEVEILGLSVTHE